MAIDRKITCDVCKREKGLTNHWWIVNASFPVLLPIEQGVVESPFVRPNVILMPFDRASSEDIDQGTHACSHECAHKLIEQWMAKIEGKP